jgi:hypothetical protein
MEEMLCPECMGPLETADGKRARCTLHGGEYEILFSRSGVPAGVATAGPSAAAVPPSPQGAIAVQCPKCGQLFKLGPKFAGRKVRCTQCQEPFDVPGARPSSGAVCTRHPGNPAKFACRKCGALICDTCASAQADGSRLCPDCAAASGPARTAPSAALVGVMCGNHPESQAARRCKVCRAPVCETCLFEFPGKVFLCPTCATSSDKGVTPKRMKYMVGSLVCAVMGTLGYVVLFGAIPMGLVRTESDLEALGVITMLWILGSAIPGVALASAARFPGRPRPASVWAALVWNVVLLAAFLLLIVVGNMS